MTLRTVRIEPADLAGIVLAAGAASRFGGPKPLARVGGETLVGRAARLAGRCCGAGVVVVTGAHAEAVAASLATAPVHVAYNSDWRSGLAASLGCGLDALPPQARACLVLPCDQPALDETDLASLAAAWAAAPGVAAAAAFDGTLGAPAIFPEALWPRLRALRGDTGARGLLAALPQVTAVPMPHAALDVDTPADLARLQPG